MEKIICDVCGTSFSDTADQCPICGCARPESSKTISEGGEVTATPRYSSVKGGRFSTRNVKKRILESGGESPKHEEEPVEIEKDGTSIGLTIAVIALLVCICTVIVFIYFRFFKDGEPIAPPETEDTTPIIQSTPAPSGPESQNIPCTAIQLESSRTVLSEEGASWLLHVKVLPENTSDKLEFESKNPLVATVTADGKITAVSKGRTAIVIICGDITAEFEVVCDIPEETTVEPTEETTVPPTTEPKHQNVRISATDVTLKVGESFNLRLRDGSGETMDVVWEASSAGYVSIDGNTIKALKSIRDITVSCTFEGKTYTCIVRIK